MSLHSSQWGGLAWRTATKSGAGGCVEVAPVANGVAVRDSKDPQSPVLLFTPTEWLAFIDGAKKGEFDNLV